jgi:lactoylglutathione lyase
MRIDHTAIWVNDLEGERDFFIKYFDCTFNEKYVNPIKRFSSYFLTFPGGGRIEIMKKDNIGPAGEHISLGYAHIAVNTGSREKVDSLTWLMRKDGIIIESGPRVTGDGYYESVILDPENNRIELVSE